MAIYIYRAKKGPTELATGEIDAISEDDAVRKLEGMGLVPVNVTAKRSPTPIIGNYGSRTSIIAKRQIAPRSVPQGIRVKTQDVNTFTRELVSLVKSNVSILSSLSLIAEETQGKALKMVVSDMEKGIRDGKMLSEALEKYPNIFDNFYISMVKAGEKGGVLDKTLTKLAEYREREDDMRRKIQAAMAYPALVIVVGIGTIFIMLTFFLPKLTGLFENMSQALPLPTKILLGISKFMSGNWHWILILMVLFIAILFRIKPGSKKKFVIDIIKLRVPFVRKFIMNAELAKFTKTLGLLLGSGIPIHESLDHATKTLDNEALKEGLYAATKDIVSQGATLSQGLKKINILPAFLINMVAVGEEGGKLEGVLEEISAVYEREVEQAMKIAASLVEPLLILAVGSVVGFIVFAMLLPIFNMGIMGR